MVFSKFARQVVNEEEGGGFIYFTAASHKNISSNLIEFTTDTLPTRRRKKSMFWESEYRHTYLTKELLTESLLDIETRLLIGGSHIYSRSLKYEHFLTGPHDELSVRKDLPIVCVFTSSLDEFIATQALQ